MTHLRTTIRRTFIEVLESALSETEYSILGTRTSRRNRDDTASVRVQFLDVNVAALTMGDDRTHTGTLLIRVQRGAPEEDLDDLLDLDEVRVTNAINTFDWSDLLEEQPEMTQITFDRDDTTDVTIGQIALRFTVEYRINKFNPNLMRS